MRRPNRLSAGRGLLFLCFLFFSAMPARAADDAVSVLYAALRPAGDNWVLDAALDVRLNHTQEEALKKGIPLNFLTEVKLERIRPWWINEDLAAIARSGRLNYSPLTRRYQLETTEGFKAYDTLPEALAELGRSENWVIVPGRTLKPGNVYLAALRLRLDVGQLSKPLQINALASGEMGSGKRLVRVGKSTPSMRYLLAAAAMLGAAVVALLFPASGDTPLLSEGFPTLLVAGSVIAVALLALVGWATLADAATHPSGRLRQQADLPPDAVVRAGCPAAGDGGIQCLGIFPSTAALRPGSTCASTRRSAPA